MKESISESDEDASGNLSSWSELGSSAPPKGEFEAEAKPSATGTAATSSRILRDIVAGVASGLRISISKSGIRGRGASRAGVSASSDLVLQKIVGELAKAQTQMQATIDGLIDQITELRGAVERNVHKSAASIETRDSKMQESLLDNQKAADQRANAMYSKLAELTAGFAELRGFVAKSAEEEKQAQDRVSSDILDAITTKKADNVQVIIPCRFLQRVHFFISGLF